MRYNSNVTVILHFLRESCTCFVDFFIIEEKENEVILS